MELKYILEKGKESNLSWLIIQTQENKTKIGSSRFIEEEFQEIIFICDQVT